MLFDSTLLFYHATSAYAFTAGEFVNLAGVTNTSTSSVINLGNARDLGVGQGAEQPTVVAVVGTAITSSLATMSLQITFQGSTDSSTWTNYLQTSSSTTASFAAGNTIAFQVPRRPPGVALPLYYRLNLTVTGNGTAGISTGTILAGIVNTYGNALDIGQYPAGFSVA